MGKILYLDLECDGLLYDVSKIWCAVAYDPARDQFLIHHDDEHYQTTSRPSNCIFYPDISIFLLDIQKYDSICMHNGISYDILVLEKLYRYPVNLDKIIDTFVMSSLFYPDRESHSLEWWGKKVGEHKGSYNDWSRFTQELLDYCIQDVKTLVKVHKALEEESADWDWSLSLRIEKSIALIMARQEQHGVLFDVEKAEVLLEKIEKEIEEIEVAALEEIPKKAVQKGPTATKVFKKNGEYTQQVEDWIDNGTLSCNNST